MQNLDYDKTCELLKNVDFMYSPRPSHKIYEAMMSYTPSAVLRYTRDFDLTLTISIAKLVINYGIDDYNFLLKLKQDHGNADIVEGEFVFYTSVLIEIKDMFKNEADILHMFNSSGTNRVMMHMKNNISNTYSRLILFDPFVEVKNETNFDHIITNHVAKNKKINFRAFVHDQKSVENNCIRTTKESVHFYLLIPISFKEAVV
jgi:hypothetical protein